MKILVVHSRYRIQGGEETVFEQEVALLRHYGHEVTVYDRSNWETADYSALKKVRVPAQTIWSEDARRELQALIQRSCPDIAHFHNTHFMISPAGYYACHTMNIPVVQTIHNFRLSCVNGWFFRDERPCEDCVGKVFPWPAILHACYHASRPHSATMVAMLITHRMLRTWQTKVDRYIALTHFARTKLIQAAVPASKIRVIANFLQPEPPKGDGAGGYALFVGRLSSEKGIGVLLKAWEKLGPRLPLKIAGDGPMKEQVCRAAEQIAGIEWLGRVSKNEVLHLMQGAFALIFPSIWYEMFPMVIIEAFASGLPVIGSALGNTQEIIDPERTGLLFQPDDPEDLCAKVDWLLSHPAERANMQIATRAEYESRFTAERHHQQLMSVFEEVVAAAPNV